MPEFTIHSRFCASLAALILSACSMAPEQDYVALAGQPIAQFGQWPAVGEQSLAHQGLLDLVSSPAMHDLVQRGLASNLSLKQSVLAVDIARLTLNTSRAALLPQINAGLDRESRQGQSSSSSSSSYSSSSYSASLNVALSLDIWGKQLDSLDAKEAFLAGSVAAQEYAADTLASNIMDAYLQIVLAKQLLDLDAKRVQLLQSNEQTILEQYRAGLGNLNPLNTAKRSTASAQSSLSARQQSLQSLERTLASLLGQQTPVSLEAFQFPAVYMPLVQLADQDLARRGDLRQAYLGVVESAAESRVAYKELLPSLSLSAVFSQTETALSDALLTSPAWQLLGQLSAPLFRGGALRQQAQIAELKAEQSYWQFQQSILQAVQEVENVISLERSLLEQQQFTAAAVEASARAKTDFEEQYRNGLVDFLDLVNVQNTHFDLQSQYAQITYQRLSNRIQLGLALGLGV